MTTLHTVATGTVSLAVSLFHSLPLAGAPRGKVPTPYSQTQGTQQGDSGGPIDGVLPIGQSDRDASGRYTVWVDIPDQPVTVAGGSEERVYRRRYLFLLPGGAELREVESFIGADAGDLYEADVELISREGIRLYQRSPHHSITHETGTVPDDCDAWKSKPVEYTCADASGCYVEVVLLGRVTDRNMSPQNPNYGELLARFHFGLRLQVQELTSPGPR